MRDLNKPNNTPLEIDLLFDNKKLDAMKYLLVMYTRQKKMTVTELLYYFSIVNISLEEYTEIPRMNIYLKNRKEISGILIFLSNLNYILIEGDFNKNIDNFKVKITEIGIDFVENAEINWMMEYIGLFKDIMSKNRYEQTKGRFNQILWGDEKIVKSE
ncbi:TPA: hypothetical protein RHK00_002851 [Enterococcus faecalis]|nr:hypothetical protein [Enterococcus faecalis]